MRTKRLISLTVAWLFAFTPVLASIGESDTWDCPKCGRTGNTGNFCGSCANPRSVITLSPTVMPEPEPTPESVPAVPWPVRAFTGVSTSLSPVNTDRANGRRQAYFGPDKYDYAGGGAFKPYAVQNAMALFREGDYALVDFYDPNVGKCCVYFPVGVLTNREMEEVTLIPYPARTTAKVQPMEGPGNDYHKVDNTMKNQRTGEWYRVLVELPQDTRIDVFFESEG